MSLLKLDVLIKKMGKWMIDREKICDGNRRRIENRNKNRRIKHRRE